MLTPPNAINVLAIIDFRAIEMLVEERVRIPRVISNIPHKTDSITFVFDGIFKILLIAVDKRLKNPTFFKISIIKKLKTIYDPTIKIDISES